MFPDVILTFKNSQMISDQINYKQTSGTDNQPRMQVKFDDVNDLISIPRGFIYFDL